MQFTDSIVRKPSRLLLRLSQSDRLFHQPPDVGRQCGRGDGPTAPARTRSDPVELRNLPCKRRHAYATINQYRSPKPVPYGWRIGYIACVETHCSYDAPSAGAAAGDGCESSFVAVSVTVSTAPNLVDARRCLLDNRIPGHRCICISICVLVERQCKGDRLKFPIDRVCIRTPLKRRFMHPTNARCIDINDPQ